MRTDILFLLIAGNVPWLVLGQNIAADGRQAFQALIQLGDRLFRTKAWLESVEIHEFAFRVRDISMEAYDQRNVSPDAFVMYGLALEALHEEKALERAIAVLEEGKVLHPDHKLIHFNLGVYLMDTKGPQAQEEALKEFNWVLERDPLNAGCLYNRALLLMHMGRWEDAAQSLEQAIPAAISQYGVAWYASSPWVIRQHEQLLAGVTIHPSRTHDLQDFVERAFPLVPKAETEGPEPLILEFGVANGRSIGTIARHVAMHRRANQLVHGFDSFIGLPERWCSDDVGEYSQDGISPDKIMPTNVRFHAGWFNETLPPFLAQHPGQPVVAIHLDADLYSSTVDVLDLLVTRMPPGCVVRFDEYYLLRAGDEKSATEFDQHEARAWRDIMARYGIEAEAVSWHGQAVTFVVLKNPSFGLSSDDGGASPSTR